MALFTEEQETEIKALARAEIKDSVNEALREFFASKGTLARNTVFTAAGIITALTVIFGGIAKLASLLGIGFISSK